VRAPVAQLRRLPGTGAAAGFQRDAVAGHGIVAVAHRHHFEAAAAVLDRDQPAIGLLAQDQGGAVGVGGPDGADQQTDDDKGAGQQAAGGGRGIHGGLRSWGDPRSGGAGWPDENRDRPDQS
jgi:hypothetical protein